LTWLLSCAAPEPELRADATPTGVHLSSDQAFSTVEVRDRDGVVFRRTFPAPVREADVAATLDPGPYTAHVDRAHAAFEVEEAEALAVTVLPSPGGAWVRGPRVEVPVAGRAEVLVALTPGPGAPSRARLGDEEVDLSTGRVMRSFVVVDRPISVVVGDGAVELVPVPLDPSALRVVGARFPADATGAPDLGRPDRRVTLPSAWWDAAIRAAGLGGRRRDAWAPWAFWAVDLENDGDRPLDATVRMTVPGDAEGAFTAHLRDVAQDEVAVLVRVPAHGRATAALPLFVAEDRVKDGAWEAAIEVAPLGSQPTWRSAERFWVLRGDTAAQVGFTATVGATLGGGLWIARRLRRWLEEAATSELMTISLFGSALFVVGTASDILSMAVGAVLGPFATVVTGLVSDVGRYVLLGTLLALLPRPGILSLALCTGFVLRGVAMGSFAPADLLYLGASVAFHELAAWISGLSRGREATWARLSGAFGGAAVAVTLSGLWLHVILYRLFFATWYVALQVLVPGLLYTVIACRLAAPFAASLRKVEA
jgi:hypothetical protein